MSKNTNEIIKHIVKNIPNQSGVYIFKDKNKKIIYIGKAINLKKRVSSYFNKQTKSTKTNKMISQISDIDYTVVSSELEAILLETNLIKEHQPKYNILMKDDKNFVYLKITVNEDFPRIFITRKVLKDKAKYFGPKTAKIKLEKTLKILQKIFPYRSCNLQIIDETKNKNKLPRKVTVQNRTIKYPCIDYHIKKCDGPCIGEISPEEYKKIINSVIDFFEGKQDKILQTLRNEMKNLAISKEFEKAAKIRDKIILIENILEKQNISAPDNKNLDVINYIKIENISYFNLFQVRNGKLINQENFQFTTKDSELDDDKELLKNFIQQYYEKATDIPKEILIPQNSNKKELLMEWLTILKGEKVKIIIPIKGRNNKLLELSKQNAENYAKLTKIKWEGNLTTTRKTALKEAKNILNIKSEIKRIECFDVSHISGTHQTASMVVFLNGLPKKDHYRKFKLSEDKNQKPNDLKSIKEVLDRRLKYIHTNTDQKYRLTNLTKKDLSIYKINNRKKSLFYFKIVQNKEIKHIFKVEKISNNYIAIFNEITDNQVLLDLTEKLLIKFKIKKLYAKIDSKNIDIYEKIGYQKIKKLTIKINTKKQEEILLIQKHNLKKDDSLNSKPDLIVVDGGIEQLKISIKVLNKYNIKIPIISISEKNEILSGKSKLPINSKNKENFNNLIRHLRDEAHRFALKYHHKLKKDYNIKSKLDEITGIGEKTKKILLNKYSTIENIKNTPIESLQKVVGKQKAKIIKKELK